MLIVNNYNALLMFSGFKRWVSTPTGQAENVGVLMPLESTNDRGDLGDKYPSLLTSLLDNSKIYLYSLPKFLGRLSFSCLNDDWLDSKHFIGLSLTYLTSSLLFKRYLGSSPQYVTFPQLLVSRSTFKEPKVKYLLWSGQSLTFTI